MFTWSKNASTFTYCFETTSLSTMLCLTAALECKLTNVNKNKQAKIGVALSQQDYLLPVTQNQQIYSEPTHKIESLIREKLKASTANAKNTIAKVTGFNFSIQRFSFLLNSHAYNSLVISYIFGEMPKSCFCRKRC